MYIVQFWNHHSKDWMTLDQCKEYKKTDMPRTVIESAKMNCRIYDDETYEIVYETGEIDIGETLVKEKIPMKSIVINDYVLTPCRNAFNQKISFWISKRGYTVALYCFSVSDWDIADYHRHIDPAALDSYIQYFNNKYAY